MVPGNHEKTYRASQQRAMPSNRHKTVDASSTLRYQNTPALGRRLVCKRGQAQNRLYFAKWQY